MKAGHRAVPWLLALLAATLATALGHLLDPYMSAAGLAMVYLVAVVVTALVLDRAASLAASLLCVLALNFFFVPPRYTFSVDGAEYWWTLAVLAALSLGMNALVASLRSRRARAELGEARAAQLHALSEALAQKQGGEQAALAAATWLQDTLGVPCAVFLGQEHGQPLRCVCVEPGAAFHPASAQWAMDHGRTLGRGCDDWPELPLWCAPFARTGSMGAVQLLLEPGRRPDAGTRRHWTALARQVGLSVEREQAAQLARSAQERAQAEAARNTLLASLSHDLRTPLAGILGNASTLRAHGDGMPAGQRDRLLANLENDARDMTLMSENILQVARLSQPQSELKTQWESLEEILGVAAERMRRRWPQARIELRVPRGLPPVRAEAALLAQAIANLVDNAVRHSGAEPRIAIQAGRSREGIFFAVRDHGQGLPPGDPELLFERFGQHGRDGTAGLGLALCRLVAQAHGGRIQAQRCEPGVEFRIDLPVATQEVTP